MTKIGRLVETDGRTARGPASVLRKAGYELERHERDVGSGWWSIHEPTDDEVEAAITHADD